MNDIMNKKSKISTIARTIGTKSTIAAIIVFLLTIVATCVGGYWLYRATKAGHTVAGQGERRGGGQGV